MNERHVNLGNLVKRYGACPFMDMHPTNSKYREEDFSKIWRNLNTSIAVNQMADRLLTMAGDFPPYGLVHAKKAQSSERPEPKYECVDENMMLERKTGSLPQNYRYILNTFLDYLRDTLEYILRDPHYTDDAVLNRIRMDTCIDPVEFIKRGINTAKDEFRKTFYIILEYHSSRELRITFEDFRRYAQNSFPYVSFIASHNIKHFGPIARRLDIEEGVVLFDPTRSRVIVDYPNHRELIQREAGNTDSITTGCPALYSIEVGGRSPLHKIYHRFLDIVA